MRISDWSSDVCSADLDLLLPALFEGLARRQPPQDWPWLADHLRAVGGLGTLAQDPVARPLLARFFHAKDSSLWLAMQRIGEGDRSEERRVGEEGVSTCRYRVSQSPNKKKTNRK